MVRRDLLGYTEALEPEKRERQPPPTLKKGAGGQYAGIGSRVAGRKEGGKVGDGGWTSTHHKSVHPFYLPSIDRSKGVCSPPPPPPNSLTSTLTPTCQPLPPHPTFALKLFAWMLLVIDASEPQGDRAVAIAAARAKARQGGLAWLGHSSPQKANAAAHGTATSVRCAIVPVRCPPTLMPWLLLELLALAF